MKESSLDVFFPTLPHLLGDSASVRVLSLTPVLWGLTHSWIFLRVLISKGVTPPISGCVFKRRFLQAERYVEYQWDESLRLGCRVPDTQREEMFPGRKAVLSSHPSDHMPRAVPVVRGALFLDSRYGTAGLPSKSERSAKTKTCRPFFHIQFEFLWGHTAWALESVWKEKWSQMWSRACVAAFPIISGPAGLRVAERGRYSQMLSADSQQVGEWEGGKWRFSEPFLFL